MKIKYVGLQEKIFISFILNKRTFVRHFTRNVWQDIKDESDAEFILKNPYFISEKHLIFDHKQEITETILIKRGYALGDLIQLVPVIKYMKRKLGLKFALWTSPQYATIMKWFNIFEAVFDNRPKKNYKHFLILDGVLESDHSLSNSERNIHRIKIFENFFKIEIDEYDFTPER